MVIHVTATRTATNETKCRHKHNATMLTRALKRAIANSAEDTVFMMPMAPAAVRKQAGYNISSELSDSSLGSCCPWVLLEPPAISAVTFPFLSISGLDTVCVLGESQEHASMENPQKRTMPMEITAMVAMAQSIACCFLMHPSVEDAIP